jgi:predicted DNA-binding transcriptional regulator YafY
VTITASEATAIAVALAAVGSIPFAADAASALRKVLAAMTDSGREHARELAQRIRLLGQSGELERGSVVRAVERAVVERRVLSIDYLDKVGVRTERRLVEPHSLAGSEHGWYLLAWCRPGRRRSSPSRSTNDDPEITGVAFPTGGCRTAPSR